ncbi:MAG: hypothetical protein RMJ07_05970 [Nitrososphaerota archaeon]|nr:hypothetical protein [Candidatus Bathyarchaeota archaeon]MDW8049205.1 hypothetical protein [Nitrososphaerota archaeon]
MERFKLVYVGACSHRFSIGLFRNIVAAKSLHPMDVVLVDIDEKLLRFVQKILENMADNARADIRVESTTDRREAFENADFIYISISVGAQESEWTDIHIPLKFGIPQNTGDTIGPGGIFRGLRCIPVFADIIRDAYDICPKAVVLNYTNPMSTLVLTAYTVAPNLQTIGLCHELFGGMRVIQELMRQNGYEISSWEELEITYGGINHLGWLMTCKFGGEDIYPLIRDKAPECFKTGFLGRALNFYLLMKHGLYPYPGSRHVAEFIPKYYNYFNYLQSPFGIVKIRDVEALDLGHKWTVLRFVAMARPWYKDRLPTPDEGGEKAMAMTVDWKFGLGRQYVVNIPNSGLVSNLPSNCIVEVPGYFDKGRIRGVKVGKLPRDIAKIVDVPASNQRNIVEAALRGDKDLLLKALLKDPMCSFIEDPGLIEDMMNVMLYYQRKWLPRFEDIPGVEELKKRRWVEPWELQTREEALKVKYPPRMDLQSKSWPNID